MSEETLVLKTTSVPQMQQIREQLKAMNERLGEDEATKRVVESGENMVETINELEEKRVQMKQKTFQDVINFPHQLDTHLKHLKNVIDGSVPPVTEDQKQRFADVMSEWDTRKAEIQILMDETIPTYSQLIRENNIPYSSTEEEKTDLL